MSRQRRDGMLLNQSRAHCILAFITLTLSQQLHFQSSSGIEQPVGIHAYDLSDNPLFTLHKDLVNIESISGNEQAVAEFLEACLTSHNYTVERQYLNLLPRESQNSQTGERSEHERRFNLLAYPGEIRQTPILLSSVRVLSELSLPFLCCLSGLACLLREQDDEVSCFKASSIYHVIRTLSWSVVLTWEW